MSTLKFDEGRLMQVLVAPIVSEKATMVAEKSNAVTFKVLQNATKPEIKAAVELMFKVEVKGAKSLYSAIKEVRKQHPFETHRIINVEQRGLDRLTS